MTNYENLFKSLYTINKDAKRVYVTSNYKRAFYGNGIKRDDYELKDKTLKKLIYKDKKDDKYLNKQEIHFFKENKTPFYYIEYKINNKKFGFHTPIDYLKIDNKKKYFYVKKEKGKYNIYLEDGFTWDDNGDAILKYTKFKTFKTNKELNNFLEKNSILLDKTNFKSNKIKFLKTELSKRTITPIKTNKYLDESYKSNLKYLKENTETNWIYDNSFNEYEITFDAKNKLNENYTVYYSDYKEQQAFRKKLKNQKNNN